MRGRRHLVLPFLVSGLALLPAAHARAADLAALRARLTRDSTAISAMLDRGATDSAFAAAHVTTAALRGSGDPAFDARVTLFEPGLSIRLARPNDALPGVLVGQKLAAASRDTAVWMLSMRMEAMIDNYKGAFDQAEKARARWEQLAVASGNVEYQAWAATMLGWFEANRGDFAAARRDLERAVPMFERVHHPVGLPYTLNVLGGVLSAQGDYVGGRALYLRMQRLANETGNVRLQVMSLENLGRIESRIGDPSRAVALWREALPLREMRKESDSWLVDADNVIVESIALGRHDEALRLAEQAVTLSERESLGLETPWQRTFLGEALAASGRGEAAKRAWRGVIAARGPQTLQPASLAASDLIETLIDEDSTQTALALANTIGAELAPAAEQEVRGRLVAAHARLLVDGGRAREALALARPMGVELERTGDLEVALAVWTQIVRAERRVGPPDSVAHAIARATAVWERGRSHANDLEFRELRGEQAHTLMLAAASEALAHPPAGETGPAAAFAALQRFKTRTLLERVAGPAAVADTGASWLAPPLVELARFQREVLAPDELFLEFASGRDSSRVLAITRDTCRVLTLPGERELAPALDLIRESGADATAAPGAGAGDAKPAATAASLAIARLSQALLGGVGDLLRTHAALIVAADGALQRVPFAVLEAPGAGEPLVSTHRVSLAPSASLLALLRGRAADTGHRLFAMAGAPRRGRAPLPGARREVDRLAAHYREVDSWFASARSPAPLTPARLAGYRALHFAGHAQVDDQLPWRSGLLIGADTHGEDSLLTADRIATTPLVASLVVLSSCESAGGRAREGEGVSGLSSAFLAAGSRAVVASLWPVDDRATETLMARFYDELARGASADRALAAAQNALRADPATAAPANWAGFVLTGDGRTTLPLARRPLPFAAPGPLGLVVLALIVLAGIAAALGWSRSRAAAS